MTDNGTVEIDDAFVSLTEDGIVEIRHKSGLTQTLETLNQQYKATRSLAGDSLPVPVMIVIGEMKGQTGEVRQALARGEELVQIYSAAALVFRTAIARVMASLFTGLYQPGIPVRAFSEEDAAMAWLRDQ